MIEKGNDDWMVITAVGEDFAHARAREEEAEDAMIMRTLAAVHMSLSRATGMSGSEQTCELHGVRARGREEASAALRRTEIAEG